MKRALSLQQKHPRCPRKCGALPWVWGWTWESAGGDRAAAAGQLSYNCRCPGLSCSHGGSRGSNPLAKGVRQFSLSIMQQSKSVIRRRLRPAVCDLGTEGAIRQRRRTGAGFSQEFEGMSVFLVCVLFCQEIGTPGTAARRRWRGGTEQKAGPDPQSQEPLAPDMAGTGSRLRRGLLRALGDLCRLAVKRKRAMWSPSQALFLPRRCGNASGSFRSSLVARAFWKYAAWKKSV